jgi:hypothetical protein
MNFLFFLYLFHCYFLNYLVLAFPVCFCSHKCILRCSLDTPVTGKCMWFDQLLVSWWGYYCRDHDCSLHTQEFVHAKIISRETREYVSKQFWSRNRLMIWCSTLAQFITFFQFMIPSLWIISFACNNWFINTLLVPLYYSNLAII